MSLTIAICTHNRSNILGNFLRKNIDALIGHKNIEILVIDNASTDDTQSVIRDLRLYAEEINVKFRDVIENQLGLSAARNRAIIEVKSNLLAYIDDDAYIDSSWIASVVGHFINNPDTVAAGGQVFPIYSDKKPAWLHDSLLWAYSVTEKEFDFYGGKNHPLGVNMIFRVEIIRDFNFNQKLGRVGSNLISGEETMFFSQIFKRYPAGVRFIKDATVFHYIPKERLQKAWLERRYAAEGRSKALIINTSGSITLKLKALAVTLLKLIAAYIIIYFTKNEPRHFLMIVRIIGWRSLFSGILKNVA